MNSEINSTGNLGLMPIKRISIYLFKVVGVWIYKIYFKTCKELGRRNWGFNVILFFADAFRKV